MFSYSIKLKMNKLKKSTKNFYRKYSLIFAWKRHKYSIGSKEPLPLEFPGDWLIAENDNDDVFKIPISLFDAFNYDFADADWKGGVKAYRKNHYSTLLSYLQEFSKYDVFYGDLDLTKSGKIGGRLEVFGGGATHRWAALVWNNMYEGYPVPDVPVRLTLIRLNEKIVESIIKNFYVLYGPESAISPVSNFLSSKGIKVETILSGKYCLVDRTTCPKELIGIILADLSKSIREVSYELRSVLKHQEEALRFWEETKEQLKSQKDWQQEVCLLASSKAIGKRLSLHLKYELRSLVPYMVESRLPCEAVLYFKGFPLAAFLKESGKCHISKKFFPKAKLFRIKVNRFGDQEILDIEEI